MGAIRTIKETDFSVIANDILWDSRLSPKARFILIFCLSVADNWEFNVEGLSTCIGITNGAINAGLQELEKACYLKRTRLKGDKGRLAGYDYTFYEKPFDNYKVPRKPYIEKPYMDKPYIEKPYMENQVLLNTNKLNTNIITEEKPKGSKKKNIPTLEQVQEFIKSRNSTVNADNFYDYYSAGDWIDAKGEPVKNWKLRVLSWERRDKKRAELQATIESKLPKEQVNRFKALLKGTLKLEQWSKKERQVVSAIGFQELKLRRAGEEEKWLEKLCNEFIKLGD